MRITKKYTGNSSIGKRTFTPLVRSPENVPFIEMSQRELEDLRSNWISKLLLAEQWNHRKLNLLKTGAKPFFKPDQQQSDDEGTQRRFSHQPSTVQLASSSSSFQPSSTRPLSSSSYSADGSRQMVNSNKLEESKGIEGSNVQIKEESISNALKPYIPDTDKLTRIVAWFKSACNILNSSSSSSPQQQQHQLNEINHLIEIGELSLPVLEQLLKTTEIRNNSEFQQFLSHHIERQKQLNGIKPSMMTTQNGTLGNGNMNKAKENNGLNDTYAYSQAKMVQPTKPLNGLSPPASGYPSNNASFPSMSFPPSGNGRPYYSGSERQGGSVGGGVVLEPNQAKTVLSPHGTALSMVNKDGPKLSGNESSSTSPPYSPDHFPMYYPPNYLYYGNPQHYMSPPHPHQQHPSHSPAPGATAPNNSPPVAAPSSSLSPEYMNNNNGNNSGPPSYRIPSYQDYMHAIYLQQNGLLPPPHHGNLPPPHNTASNLAGVGGVSNTGLPPAPLRESLYDSYGRPMNHQWPANNGGFPSTRPEDHKDISKQGESNSHILLGPNNNTLESGNGNRLSFYPPPISINNRVNPPLLPSGASSSSNPSSTTTAAIVSPQTNTAPGQSQAKRNISDESSMSVVMKTDQSGATPHISTMPPAAGLLPPTKRQKSFDNDSRSTAIDEVMSIDSVSPLKSSTIPATSSAMDIDKVIDNPLSNSLLSAGTTSATNSSKSPEFSPKKNKATGNLTEESASLESAAEALLGLFHR
jgi:hypothetical protein